MPTLPTKSNVPQHEPLRWNVEKAAREFGVANSTVKRRLNEVAASPDKDGLYSTEQLVEALFGSMHVEKLKTQRQITERYALENAITRAAVLNRAELTKAFSALADALVTVINRSELSRQGKEDFLKNLSSWPVLLQDVAAAQSKFRCEKSKNAKSEEIAESEEANVSRPGRPLTPEDMGI
jgi:hypothetical protein